MNIGTLQLRHPDGETCKWYHYRNYHLLLDRSERDAMIYRTDRLDNIICSNTYWCVIGEGEMEDGQVVADSIYKYFDDLSVEIDHFLYD